MVAGIQHSSGFDIAEALDARAVQACRELFVEYQQGLGVSLCLQGLEREPAGCVALRSLEGGDGEMKRLYVRPAHRGMGIGRMLAECVIDEARALGYTTLKLDTLPAMKEAQRTYEELGFLDTDPYNDNPVDGVRFLALDLAAR